LKFFIQNDDKDLILNNNEDKELAKVISKDNKYFLSNKVESNLQINNDSLTNLQDKIWHVVKSISLNNNSNSTSANNQSNFTYSLKKNDIVKLGRIKFLIRDINIVGIKSEETCEIFNNYKQCSFIQNNEANICRICLMYNAEENNPMISICKCKGSVSLIHFLCLKNWLQHKLSVREMNNKLGISYTVKAYNCEICKEPYPITVKYNENSYNLLNYSIPENQNYVIVESLNSIKENQYPLSFHILVFLENDSFILGRGHDSDVRISDISVSRVHSKIYFQDNKLYLEDCGSKFGTLVLAKDEIEITDQNSIVQIGRSLISMCNSKNKIVQKIDSIDNISDYKKNSTNIKEFKDDHEINNGILNEKELKDFELEKDKNNKNDI